jgi:hypothetical protein
MGATGRDAHKALDLGWLSEFTRITQLNSDIRLLRIRPCGGNTFINHASCQMVVILSSFSSDLTNSPHNY